MSILLAKNLQCIGGTNVENTKENYHRHASHIASTDVGPMVNNNYTDICGALRGNQKNDITQGK